MIVRAIIQARMLSSRLRGKSLMAVAGRPLLDRVIERVGAMPFIDQICVATTRDAADEPIMALVESRGIRCTRGDRDDVLGRFLQASADLSESDLIVRFTADNPLYDPTRSAKAFESHMAGAFDYTHIDGLSHMVPEFVRVGALRAAGQATSDPFDREHVTPFLRKRADLFKAQTLPPNFASLRPDLDQHLTIDRQEQLEMFERMLAEVERPQQLVRLDDCYLWLDSKKAGLQGILKEKTGQLRVNIAGHEVGDGCPCFIVAEVGQNHNGQMGMARRLIEMAANCGADAVKFQKRDIRWELTAEAYNAPYDNSNSFGPTYGKHREYLELSEEQHAELKEYANARNLIYFCTACDEPSVDMMERIGNPVYKIASRDITNIPLLHRVARTGKPVIVSTGMAGLDEIREAIEALESPPGLIITHCVSQYPTEIENVNLRALKTIRDEFGCLVGLSDHTSGIITAVAAAVMGVCFVEKHVTLSRAMQGSDHAAALEEEGLRRLIRYIRSCAVAMGDGRKVFVPAVENTRRKLSRSLVSKADIPRGTVLNEEMLVLKSPGTGLAWRDRAKVVGRAAKVEIPADTLIAEAQFE